MKTKLYISPDFADETDTEPFSTDYFFLGHRITPKGELRVLLGAYRNDKPQIMAQITKSQAQEIADKLSALLTEQASTL